jgi:CheY-like chemotaxis protein
MTSEAYQINHLKPNILIADDQSYNILLVKLICRSILPDATIVEALNGLESVRIFREMPPDIIFMDVNMPEMDGCDATKAIRKLEQNSHVPIIGVSAGLLNAEKERCLSSGMDDYICKPILKDILESVFRKWLL